MVDSGGFGKMCSLEGVISALPSPMDAETENIDIQAFQRIIKWQLANGIVGFVVGGTTGESGSLRQSEWEELIRVACCTVDGAVPVIAGTGTNCTRTTIEKTIQAMSLHADAALVVAPYYVKPTQDGLFRHFEAVAANVPNFPIILYNVRGRTACDILPATVKRLHDTCRNIIGVKECGGNERCEELRRLCGPSFRIYSGEDGEAGAAVLSHGANGAVSVTAVAAPAQFVEMYRYAACGDVVNCASAVNSLRPLVDALFAEPNPTPIKWLLHHLGFTPDGVRLPMLRPTAPLKAKLEDLAAKLKLDHWT